MSPRSGLVPLLVLAGLAVVAVRWVVPGAHRTEVEGARGPQGPGLAAQGPTALGPPVDLLASDDTRAARTEAVRPPDEATCLELGEAAVLGRVVDEEGLPVAGAHLVVVGAPHERDGFVARGAALSAADGSFEVHSERAGDVWVVAAQAGRRPAHRALALGEGYASLRAPLVLERGASLSGRVLAGEEPLGCVEIEAVLTSATRRVRVGAAVVALVDGRFDWLAPRTRTDEDGRWRFDGLGPERRVVRAHAFRCPSAALPCSALPAEAYEVPEDGIDLRVRVAHLALQVQDGDAPLSFVDVDVAGSGWQVTRRADADGRLELMVPPGEPLTAVVRSVAHAPNREVLDALAPGERREFQVHPGAALAAQRPFALEAGARAPGGGRVLERPGR